MVNLGLAGIAYLIGMIPQAYVFGKIFKFEHFLKIDPVAMTPERVLQEFFHWPVFLTLLIDILKGLLVAYLGIRFGQGTAMPLILLLTAIIARNYNIIVGLKGGKGIALLSGGLVFIAPLSLVPLFIFSFIMTIITGDIDYGLGLGALILTPTLFILTFEMTTILTGILLSIIIFTKHMDYVDAGAIRTKREHYSSDRNPFRHMR